MIVQHNVTGAISRAVRMVGPFKYGGQRHAAGSVIVFLKEDRRVLQPEAFAHLYTEIPEDRLEHALAIEPIPEVHF